jgi:two-component system response regulator
MIREIRTILLVEDSAADAEMTVDALREAKLANPIVHVEDGVEALDYLFARGEFAERQNGIPAVVLLDIKMPRPTASKCCARSARARSSGTRRS